MDFWGSGRGSGSHDYGYGDDDFGGAGEENEFLQDSEQAYVSRTKFGSLHAAMYFYPSARNVAATVLVDVC